MNNILKVLYRTTPQTTTTTATTTSTRIQHYQPLKNYLIINGGKSFMHLKQAYARLHRLGFSDENTLLNTILGYCFEFGEIRNAKLIFNQTQFPNITLFNTMIRGLVSSDLFDESIEYYLSLRVNGLLPNDFTCPFVLKACGRVCDFELGLKVHNLVIKLGFDGNAYVDVSLMGMYARCGDVGDARKVFDEMPQKCLISWTAIMSGYIIDGEFDEAVELFKVFLERGLRPDNFALVRFLSACANLGELETGEWLHAYIDKNKIRKDLFLCTQLIDMYAKCGCMDKASDVFDQMPEKDVVSWTAMINGYVTNDFPEKALDLFFEMEKENIIPDTKALIGVIVASTRLGEISVGEQALKSACINISTSNDLNLAAAVMDMYAKCGRIEKAWNIFKNTNERDLCFWNTAINGLSTNGYVDIAFSIFAQMEKLGVKPNDLTILGLLSGCTHARRVYDGRKLFNNIERVFCLTPSVEHFGCMVDVLSRAGLLDEAYRLIREMPMEPNVIVWGALLGGCRLRKNTQLAELVLEKLGDTNKIRKHLVLCTQLIDMYAKHGCMEKARDVFDQMREKDVVSWTAMINGYVMNDFPKNALDLFFEMEKENIKPDTKALIGVITASTKLGVISIGELALKSACVNISTSSDPNLAAAVMDMYAKNGHIEKAWNIFKNTNDRDICFWNDAINGLSTNGYVDIAFSVFAQMEKLGVKPNGNTILGLLSGCTHAGRLYDGRKLFNNIERVFCLTPSVEHFGYMVDLLCRSGLLDEAYQLIQKMPMEPNVIVWGALHGGCRLQKNTQLAKHVSEKLVELESRKS